MARHHQFRDRHSLHRGSARVSSPQRVVINDLVLCRTFHRFDQDNPTDDIARLSLVRRLGRRHRRHVHAPLAACGLVLLATVVAGGVLTMSGCAQPRFSGDYVISPSPNPGLAATSVAVEAPAFVAPHDESGWKVALAIPSVQISAALPAEFQGLSETVRSQMMNAFAASPNFQVVDRTSLAQIASEQELSTSGATGVEHRPLPGNLANAQYLVRVDVTEFREDVVGQTKKNDFQLGGIFSLAGAFVPGDAGNVLRGVGAANPQVGSASQDVQGIVGMEIRVVDVTTGTVAAATRAHGQLTQKNTRSVFGIAGISTSDDQFASSVVAQATRAAIEDAVVQVHRLLGSQQRRKTADQSVTAIGR